MALHINFVRNLVCLIFWFLINNLCKKYIPKELKCACTKSNKITSSYFTLFLGPDFIVYCGKLHLPTPCAA